MVGYPIHICTISMELSEVAGQNFYNMLNVIMSLKIAFISANSADSDQMLPNAAFHQGLHCLPKYIPVNRYVSRMERVKRG